MRIQTFLLYSYEISLTNGQIRLGIVLNITDEKGNSGWGDIAPLPKWSQETLKDALLQLNQQKNTLLNIEWTEQTYLKELSKLALFPSVSLGIEAALLSILAPLSDFAVSTSALLMGSSQEILKQAKLRQSEGYTSAKLKVSQLSFAEAAAVIHQLKDHFRLRIDVNRAWSTVDSLQFFSQFSLDAFDYVEEPFQDPQDLSLFSHPLAVDESFPQDLSLEKINLLPNLKALIYKPMIQGGLLNCLPLYSWACQRKIALILSSSFESDLGLAYIASMAHRLSLSFPIGIGTYHFLNNPLCLNSIQFSQSIVYVSPQLKPSMEIIQLHCTKSDIYNS